MYEILFFIWGISRNNHTFVQLINQSTRTMRTFAQSERSCEASFQNAGPYWHAYTSGKNTPVLFTCKEDLAFVMNVIAQAASLLLPKNIVIITFEVMNNHFHFILSGDRELIMEFFAFIRKRLKRTIPNTDGLELQLKPIESLSALRNGIVYTNRNGYVAISDYTPFSYPWGCGRYYFNDIPLHQRFGEVFLGSKREMFRGRAPELPDNWLMTDGYIAPPSYCALLFGMSLFRDAHHYFNALTKQVESYSEVAVDIDDDYFLTDTELFSKVMITIRETYKLDSLRQLTRAQLLDFARALRHKYRSSNGQIRRVLGLSQYDVNALFPLSAES